MFLRTKLAAIMLCFGVNSAIAADTTVEEAIRDSGIKSPKTDHLPASVYVAKDNPDIPYLASISVIKNNTVNTVMKFGTQDGVVSVVENGERINSHWVYVKQDVGFSAIIQEIKTGKAYRVIMMIPDDVEYGQQSKSPSSAREMLIPPMPSQLGMQ